jgi:hypothetical protein
MSGGISRSQDRAANLRHASQRAIVERAGASGNALRV